LERQWHDRLHSLSNHEVSLVRIPIRFLNGNATSQQHRANASSWNASEAFLSIRRLSQSRLSPRCTNPRNSYHRSGYATTAHLKEGVAAKLSAATKEVGKDAVACSLSQVDKNPTEPARNNGRTNILSVRTARSKEIAGRNNKFRRADRILETHNSVKVTRYLKIRGDC